MSSEGYGAVIHSNENNEAEELIVHELNDEEKNEAEELIVRELNDEENNEVEEFIVHEMNDEDKEVEDMKPSLYQEMVAECIGTCILTQVGCAGLCASKFLDAYSGLWQTAVIWLLGATLAISVTAPISGAHLNPAVSVS